MGVRLQFKKIYWSLTPEFKGLVNLDSDPDNRHAFFRRAAGH